MSQLQMFLVILAVLVPLWFRLRRDFVGGLAYACVILLTFTTLIRIETPGELPELTIQRLVFLSLAVAWWRHPHRRTLREVPFLKLMAVWAGVTLLSLVGAVDPVAGVKRYLEFVFELFVFYFILATTLNGREDAFRILRAVVIGVSIVAGLAILEKYSGFNVVDRLVGVDPESQGIRDVRVTYRHRILLGTGVAMGFPLALAMIRLARSTFRRRLAWLAAAAMLAACYFSMSRGPWLAAVGCALTIVTFGTAALRKPLIIVGLLAMTVVLMLRPGVYGTLFDKAADTLDSDSFKGGTFQYRLELYAVAYDGIRHTPWRLLFGNGPAAGLNQTIDWTLSYRAKDYGIASWDNDYAYSLFQYGFFGLVATLALYGTVAWKLLAIARRSNGIERDTYVCLCASALALFFMMSNVHVFARQLYYLLWSVAAVAFVLVGDAKRAELRRSESAEVEESPGNTALWPETAPTAAEGVKGQLGSA